MFYSTADYLQITFFSVAASVSLVDLYEAVFIMLQHYFYLPAVLFLENMKESFE